MCSELLVCAGHCCGESGEGTAQIPAFSLQRWELWQPTTTGSVAEMVSDRHRGTEGNKTVFSGGLRAGCHSQDGQEGHLRAGCLPAEPCLPSSLSSVQGPMAGRDLPPTSLVSHPRPWPSDSVLENKHTFACLTPKHWMKEDIVITLLHKTDRVSSSRPGTHYVAKDELLILLLHF